MIKILIATFFALTLSFANSQNISILNNIKKVVQKEEYISLAINKYILDKFQIPKTTDADGNVVLDWDKLTTIEYLGTDFNKINPYTQREMKIYFNGGYAFIKGAIETVDSYSLNQKFVYNYYADQVNRVNTLSPKYLSSDDTTKDKLVLGSQVKYGKLQKQIVKILDDYENDNSLPNIKTTSSCTASEKFYEMVNSELILRYCTVNGEAIDVYSNGENLVLNDIAYLDIVESPIGSKAYAKDTSTGTWSEYYYQGNVDDLTTKRWIKRENASAGDTTGTGGSNSSGNDVPIATVPGDKILVLRKDIGCMLVGGDISCWGDNSYNKFGVDTAVNPSSDYILTPVMLKSELEDISSSSTSLITSIIGSLFGGTTSSSLSNWNNSITRIKYKSLAVNNQDVCAISVDDKLYCSGKYSGTSYLKKMKDDVISVAMTDVAIAIVDKNGKLYTKGVNLNGVLGVNNTDISKTLSGFTSQIGSDFKEVYSLNSSRTFGAIDNSNSLWIWGQRTTGDLYKPTEINSTVNISEIFISPVEFIVKDNLLNFKITDDLSDYIDISVIDGNGVSAKEETISKIIYANTSNQLIYDSTLTNMACKNYDGTACSSVEEILFNNSLNELKISSNAVSMYQGSVLENIPEEPKEIFVSQQAINTWDLVGGSGNNSFVQCEYEQKDDNVSPYLRCGIKKNSKETDAVVEKSFNFGADNANVIIKISLDMYEIDYWNKDTFYVKANNDEVRAILTNDVKDSNDDENDGIILSFNLADTDNGTYGNDELHRFDLFAQLDSNGELNLEIGAIFKDEKFDTASFGIDNILIKFYAKPITDEYKDEINLLLNKKDFACVTVVENVNPKLYCWGHIDKSIPLLSTSLVNDSKISLLNNYFYDSSENIINQKTYDEYFIDGEIFLKYPTYIGSFDYDFKFR